MLLSFLFFFIFTYLTSSQIFSQPTEAVFLQILMAVTKSSISWYEKPSVPYIRKYYGALMLGSDWVLHIGFNQNLIEF